MQEKITAKQSYNNFQLNQREVPLNKVETPNAITTI